MNRIKYYLFTLGLFLPLELITTVLFGVDSIFKPYRVVELIIILDIFFTRTNFFVSMFKQKNAKIWLVIVLLGFVSTFANINSVPIDWFLVLNWIGLFVINFLLFLILSSCQINKRWLEFFSLGFFIGILINVFHYFVFPSNSIRFTGFMDNSNALAFAVILNLIFLRVFNKSLVENILFKYLLLGISFLIILESGSRGGLLLFALVLVSYINISVKSIFRLLIFIILSIPFLDTINFDMSKFITFERVQYKLEDEEEDERIMLAKAGISAAIDTYGIGLGISQFQTIENFNYFVYPYSERYAIMRSKVGKGLVTHNSFIQLASEFGIISLILFLVFFLGTLATLFKKNNNLLKLFSDDRFILFLTALIYAFVHIIFFSPFFWIIMAFLNNKTVIIFKKNKKVKLAEARKTLPRFVISD